MYCYLFKIYLILLYFSLFYSQRTLDKICLRVDNVKRSQNEQIFPEYDCLMLSPANLWGQSIQNFTGDTNILNTIFQYHVSKVSRTFSLNKYCLKNMF